MIAGGERFQTHELRPWLRSFLETDENLLYLLMLTSIAEEPQIHWHPQDETISCSMAKQQGIQGRFWAYCWYACFNNDGKDCRHRKGNNMAKGFSEKLTELLKTDTRFVDDEGELVKLAVVDRAWKIDRELVKLLLRKPEMKKKFFIYNQKTMRNT